MDVGSNGDFEKAREMIERARAAEWGQWAGALAGQYISLVLAGFSPKQAMQILLQSMWEEK